MNLKRWLGSAVILGACGCNSMNNTEAGALGGGAIGAAPARSSARPLDMRVPVPPSVPASGP